MGNNILTILFIIIIIGMIAYIYYNHIKTAVSNNNRDNKVTILNRETELNLDSHRKKGTSRPTSNQIYKKYFSPKPQVNSKTRLPNKSNRPKNDIINVDDVLSSVTRSDIRSHCDPNDITEPFEIFNDVNDVVVPSNLENDDPDAAWDANFGLPLMDSNEKKKFIAKMFRSHKDYQKSLGDFIKYQTDDSTKIRTDITIDPFKPEHNSNKLKGKTVKEIYDEQVAGPTVIPKRIKGRTASTIIYDDESENNGGRIKGTNLIGFDGLGESYRAAAFGNEF
jgi:hypothetical protein